MHGINEKVGLLGEQTMRIEMKNGKYGEDDKIILFTSTDNHNTPTEREQITIFKLGVLINQICFNELQINGGFKKRLLKKGEALFFEEAIKEAIEMAKNNINWAESHNLERVEEWAKNHSLKTENIESELKRTFQKGLDEFD